LGYDCTLMGKSGVVKEKCLKSYFVSNKYHMDLSGIKPRTNKSYYNYNLKRYDDVYEAVLISP